MKLAKTFTQHSKHCQSCYQILRNGKTHTSSQRLLSYNVKGSIKYPEKSLYVKKHPYDRETHKKYAAAMAHLKAKKRKGVGVFVENTNMITDLVKQGLSPSYIFYVKVCIFGLYQLYKNLSKLCVIFLHIISINLRTLTGVNLFNESLQHHFRTQYLINYPYHNSQPRQSRSQRNRWLN